MCIRDSPQAARPGTDYPVMVWIHGGRFEVGDHTDPTPNPEGLAQRGVVVVRVGYRLKFEGFLPLHTDPPAHYRGVADCAEALAWIQRNIEAFGGDPTNVTLVGHSAGAAIALWLTRRDHYKGEFRRAIIASPGFPRAGFEGRKWAARGAVSTPLTREALNRLAADNPARLERGYRRFRRRYPTDAAVGPFLFDATELAEVDMVVSSTREEFTAQARSIDRLGLGPAFVRVMGRSLGLKKGAAGRYIDAVHHSRHHSGRRDVAGQFVTDALIRRWVDEVCEHAPGNVWQAEFPAGAHSTELASVFAGEYTDWLVSYLRGEGVGWEGYGSRRQAMCVGEGVTRDPLGYLRGCF